MEMRSIAIIDDEKSSRDLLAEYLRRYEKEKAETFNVEAFDSSVVFLTGYKPKYDIVFLDIDMPDLNGMDMAHRLRDLDKTVEIIFVTNMAKFAVNGYEVGAFDFVVKPVSYYIFSLKLDRVLKHFKSTKISGQVIITSGTEKRCVESSKITYVEVIKHKLIYNTFDGEIISYGTLIKAEELLNDPLFVRCNNCYLVNLRYVQRIKGSFVHVGDKELLISAARRPVFEKALTDYICGGEVK